MKLTLKTNYPNDFLTTTTGYTFYRENNTVNGQHSVLEIDDNKVNSDIELKNLLLQGTLQEVNDKMDVISDIPKETAGLTTEKFDAESKEKNKKNLKDVEVKESNPDKEKEESELANLK